jgi:hypothetical protein
MNDWQIGKRIAVAVIFSGLMIATSSAQGPTTGQISGHVVDSGGATIKGASVFVRRNSPSEDNVRLVAHTDIHGDFLLLLPKGGYDAGMTSSLHRQDSLPGWRLFRSFPGRRERFNGS